MSYNFGVIVAMLVEYILERRSSIEDNSWGGHWAWKFSNSLCIEFISIGFLFVYTVIRRRIITYWCFYLISCYSFFCYRWVDRVSMYMRWQDEKVFFKLINVGTSFVADGYAKLVYFCTVKYNFVTNDIESNNESFYIKFILVFILQTRPFFF